MTEVSSDGGPNAQYAKFLAEGRFMIQRGKKSGKAVFYPRAYAPGTGEELEWVEASGKGTVYSTTVVRKKPPTPDYNIALIELEEGPRLTSRVEGVEAADVKIGMAVNAQIIDGEEGPLLVFIPAGD